MVEASDQIPEQKEIEGFQSDFLLEYEKAVVEEYYKDSKKANSESNPKGNCFVVLAKGFSVPKFVATLLYDKYSIKAEPQQIESAAGGIQKLAPRACSPYLIFIINFDEVEYQSL